MTTFSRRHGYSGPLQPITVREDAPEAFRHAVVQIAAEEGFEAPSAQRAVICRVLRTMPDRSNWSEYPNIADEVARLIEECPWYRVYDVAEAFYAAADSSPGPFGASSSRPVEYEVKLNEVLFDLGIGWKMEDGQFIFRGDQPFEHAMASAREALGRTARSTAEREVMEALKDLSRRPAPDRTGAIQHSMAALECVARDVSGAPKPTLGTLLKNYSAELAIPPPLDQAVEKAWGYASEVGRHLQEGREPSAEEAELVTTICAAVVTYLVKKQNGSAS